MRIDTERLDLLIQYTLLAAGDEDEYLDRQLGPIHILKYIYLADLNYARYHNGDSFTGITWQFYKFGPWSPVVHDRIEPALSAIHANKKQFASDYEDREDWVRWELRDDRLFDEKRRALPPAITMHLKNAIHRFGKDTPSLLDYVYKTIPMLSAAPNECLDLSLAANKNIEEAAGHVPSLRMEGLSKKKKKEFHANLVALRELRKEREPEGLRLVNPVPPPRYDNVYMQGVSWLDSLSGEQFTPDEFLAEFSGDVWKSSTRKGQDVS